MRRQALQIGKEFYEILQLADLFDSFRSNLTIDQHIFLSRTFPAAFSQREGQDRKISPSTQQCDHPDARGDQR